MNKYQIGDLVADKLNGRKMIVVKILQDQDYRECRYELLEGELLKIGTFHINELFDFVEKPVNEELNGPETRNYKSLKSHGYYNHPAGELDPFNYPVGREK